MPSASKSNLQQQPKPTPSSTSATTDAQGIPGDLATASTSQDSHCQSSVSTGAPEQYQEQCRLTSLKVAFSYLKEVEHMLGWWNITVFSELLDIIKKFKATNVDNLSMIAHVSRLFTHFKDHAQLAVGFNTFLPQDFYKIEAESNASIKLHLISIQTAVRFSQSNTSFHMCAPTTPNDQQEFDNLPADALYYLFQLKEHFGNQSDSYAEFVNSLSKYMSQQIDVFDAVIHMSTLFTGHPELIEGLNTFLTSDHEIKVQGNDVFVLQPGQPAQCLCQPS